MTDTPTKFVIVVFVSLALFSALFFGLSMLTNQVGESPRVKTVVFQEKVNGSYTVQISIIESRNTDYVQVKSTGGTYGSEFRDLDGDGVRDELYLSRTGNITGLQPGDRIEVYSIQHVENSTVRHQSINYTVSKT